LGIHNEQQFLAFVNRDPAAAVRELNRTMDVLTVRAEHVGTAAVKRPDVAHDVIEAPRKWTREEIFGKTPSKYSRTGREVRQRMRGEGRLETRNDGQDYFFDRRTQQWYPVDSAATHMGHRHDAVTWWKEGGHHFAPRSPEIEAWWQRSANYEFEYGPANSSAGAGLGEEYVAPSEDPIDTSEWAKPYEGDR
jgi:hypothetical protein